MIADRLKMKSPMRGGDFHHEEHEEPQRGGIFKPLNPPRERPGPFLVLKLHFGTHLSAQIHCEQPESNGPLQSNASIWNSVREEMMTSSSLDFLIL
jgi:hypothetical protein